MRATTTWLSDKVWACQGHLGGAEYPASIDHCLLTGCGAPRPPKPGPDKKKLWAALDAGVREKFRQACRTHLAECSVCGAPVWRRKQEIGSGCDFFCGESCRLEFRRLGGEVRKAA